LGGVFHSIPFHFHAFQLLWKIKDKNQKTPKDKSCTLSLSHVVLHFQKRLPRHWGVYARYVCAAAATAAVVVTMTIHSIDSGERETTELFFS
jgi:hypothetical protein